MVEYYTGRDASLMTEDQIALKLAHILAIRKLEKEESVIKQIQYFTRG